MNRGLTPHSRSFHDESFKPIDINHPGASGREMFMQNLNGHTQNAMCEAAAAPRLRNMKERVIQTLAYEGGGLLLIAPLYAAAFGQTATASFGLLVVLAVLVMAWAPVHNVVFDYVDARTNNRVASDRPHSLRVFHAISLETTAVLVTLPAVMWIGGFSFWGALAVDLGLTCAYTVYAYVFHLTFDWLRPVPTGA
jgi:uncharacterized membrane protein